MSTDTELVTKEDILAYIESWKGLITETSNFINTLEDSLHE